eukprot:1063081-Lingulodinium_polyedra.AAC.1
MALQGVAAPNWAVFALLLEFMWLKAKVQLPNLPPSEWICLERAGPMGRPEVPELFNTIMEVAMRQ